MADRVLKSEVEELEEEEKEREVFYELKSNEIKAFKETVEKFVLKSQMQVNELKDQVNEVRFIWTSQQAEFIFTIIWCLAVLRY